MEYHSDAWTAGSRAGAASCECKSACNALGQPLCTPLELGCQRTWSEDKRLKFVDAIQCGVSRLFERNPLHIDCGIHGMPSDAGCVCFDGASGADCKTVCSNDCLNNCGGHGTCVHGWCRCFSPWFGEDCSRRAGQTLTDAPSLLPPEIAPLAAVLTGAVHVYSLPALGG